jgi:hypothetical protein
LSAVVRSCIVQMDHNDLKTFPPTLLTDVFHQIRNNGFDKESCLIFHAFRNIQQTFDPSVTPNNRNEALFGLNFMLQNFGHVLWICGPARIMKIVKKTSFCPLLICVQTHIVDLVRLSGEALEKVRPATAFDRLPVNAEQIIN